MCSPANIQEQLKRLEYQQQILLDPYEKKFRKIWRHKRFESSPQAKMFCDEVHIRLEAIAIASKVADSKLFEIKPSNLGNTTKLISIVSSLLKSIPVAGDIIYALVNGISAAATAGDHIRQVNAIAEFSRLGTLKDFQKVAEEVALRLTESYFPYLDSLMFPEEKKQAQINKAKNGGPLQRLQHFGNKWLDTTLASTLKIFPQGDISAVANYAVAHILVFLIEGKILPGKPLAPQFLAAVSQPLSVISQLQYDLQEIIGRQMLITRNGEIWTLKEFYQKKQAIMEESSSSSKLLFSTHSYPPVQSKSGDSIHSIYLSSPSDPSVKTTQDKIVKLEYQLQESKKQTEHLEHRLSQVEIIAASQGGFFQSFSSTSPTGASNEENADRDELLGLR